MYSAPATKPAPLPSPTTARAAMASVGSGATTSTRLPATTAASARKPTFRAPIRSAARPPGIWTSRCVANSAVVNRPTTASEAPYSSDSGSATAPTLAMFHVTPAPSASAAPTGRLRPADARNDACMARVVIFAGWWAALFGLWLLLVFKLDVAELVTGAVCAAVAALGVILVKRETHVHF